MTLNKNPSAAHQLIASGILTIYRMITKHPQNGSSKGNVGHIYFEAGSWPAGKTYEDAVRAAVEEQYLPTVPVPVHYIEFFYNWAAEPDRELLKLPIRGYVQAN